jgi:hypothetical protein
MAIGTSVCSRSSGNETRMRPDCSPSPCHVELRISSAIDAPIAGTGVDSVQPYICGPIGVMGFEPPAAIRSAFSHCEEFLR